MSDTENHASLRGSSSPDQPISRRSAHESMRMRNQDEERKNSYDRHHRDRDYKDGGFKGRGKYDSYSRHRSRDYDRHNGHVRKGDIRHKYVTHSKRSRGGSRSRSRSPPRSEGKRTSGFDMAPSAADLTPAVSEGNVGLHVLPAYVSAYTL